MSKTGAGASEGVGQRLDRYLVERISGLSRATVQRLIAAGQVTVNGAPAKASYLLRAGDRILANLPQAPVQEITAEAIPLRIVYEDEALLVVDKPAGMVVHPAPGHDKGTLVNALLSRYPELAAAIGQPASSQHESRPGIVHRLDRDTSGLILVAKTETVQRALQRQFQARQVLKAYLSLVEGNLEPTWGRIEAPIGRDPHHRQRMAVLPEGREAVTEYRLVERFAPQGTPAQPADSRFGSASSFTLIEALPKTGRTHQIRVHLASIGHPVVGDRVYGRRKPSLPLSRHFLHAAGLAFRHPLSGELIELKAPLPADLAAILDSLRER